jgi:hypothetical protein
MFIRTFWGVFLGAGIASLWWAWGLYGKPPPENDTLLLATVLVSAGIGFWMLVVALLDLAPEECGSDEEASDDTD